MPRPNAVLTFLTLSLEPSRKGIRQIVVCGGVIVSRGGTIFSISKIASFFFVRFVVLHLSPLPNHSQTALPRPLPSRGSAFAAWKLGKKIENQTFPEQRRFSIASAPRIQILHGPTTINRRRRRTSSPVLAYDTLAMRELAGSGLAGVRHLHDEREKRRRPRTATGSGSCSRASNIATVKGGPLPRAPRVSPRQHRRIEDTHVYLCAKVDPVMGSLILALMEGRPDDIHRAALDHLLSKRKADGETRRTSSTASTTADPELRGRVGDGSSSASAPTGDEGEEAIQQRRLARRQDRLFMTREIGPLVTELIRRTLRFMPTDVEGFLIEQLQDVIARDGIPAQDLGSNFRRLGPYPPSSGTLGISDSGEHLGNHKKVGPTYQHRPTRPSTARSRLQQAQSLDHHVQQTSPPLSGRTAEARRSPSPPRGPKNGGLSDEDDDLGDRDGVEAPLLSQQAGGGRVVAHGVKESQNKPWDVEVVRCFAKTRVLFSYTPAHVSACIATLDKTALNLFAAWKK